MQLENLLFLFFQSALGTTPIYALLYASNAPNNCTETNWFYPGACMWAHCDTNEKYYRYNILKIVARNIVERPGNDTCNFVLSIVCLHTTTSRKNKSSCLQHLISKVSKALQEYYMNCTNIHLSTRDSLPSILQLPYHYLQVSCVVAWLFMKSLHWWWNYCC